MYYEDKDGNAVFVSNDLDPKWWAAYRKKPGKVGIHRVKSKSLPECKTREAAQRDLDEYAAMKGWKVFEPENRWR